MTTPTNGWASFDIVETHHTENKAAHARMTDQLTTLSVEMASLAAWREHVDQSLDKIEACVEESRPKPIKIWQLGAAALPIVLIFAGWIWRASRYPERDEFLRVSDATTELRTRQAVVDREIETLREAVRRVEERR